MINKYNTLSRLDILDFSSRCWRVWSTSLSLPAYFWSSQLLSRGGKLSAFPSLTRQDSSSRGSSLIKRSNWQCFRRELQTSGWPSSVTWCLSSSSPSSSTSPSLSPSPPSVQTSRRSRSIWSSFYFSKLSILLQQPASLLSVFLSSSTTRSVPNISLSYKICFIE